MINESANVLDPERNSGIRRAEKISEIIARQIIQDVVAGGIQPGDTLSSENELRAKYAVGRASLREAFRILELHGLIYFRPGRAGGAIVAAVSNENYGRMSTLYFHMLGATWGELVEARVAMEPVVAMLAATRRDPDMNKNLDRAVERSRMAIGADERQWGAASVAFHSEVSTMASNRVLDMTRGALQSIYDYRIKDHVVPIDSRVKIQAAHEDIALSIAHGDGAEAHRLMTDHMTTVTNFIRESLPGLMDEVVDWVR